MIGDPIPTVIDPESGELVPCAGCQEREEQLQAVDIQRRKDAQRIHLLNIQLEQARAEEPDAEDTRQVLDYWKQKLAPRAKTPLAGKRATKVRARLREGHTVEALKLAIDGAAAFPYDVGYGNRAAEGKKQQRRVDLDYICRDEAIVDKLGMLGVGRKLAPLGVEVLAEAYLGLRDLLLDRGLPVRENGVYSVVRDLIDQGPSNVVPLRREAA